MVVLEKHATHSLSRSQVSHRCVFPNGSLSGSYVTDGTSQLSDIIYSGILLSFVNEGAVTRRQKAENIKIKSSREPGSKAKVNGITLWVRK